MEQTVKAVPSYVPTDRVPASNKLYALQVMLSPQQEMTYHVVTVQTSSEHCLDAVGS